MNIVDSLNLARKWRSKNFDQIVGQDLVVRILKNSLYREHFFPVYLFSGQRGCGKTTTARVFAAAINCQELAHFQKNPQQSLLPCLTCLSCRAMQAGKQPDFIEIDAASHTGVDNVRSIIDAAALLPVMGMKKIYLIDEAHMLSKAAFNAFLKILEEPPATALFMLATTDPEKIIETVRSRCFQLFFKPIASPTLISHLETICQQESIEYDLAGLSLIVQETEGSARDALNTLERVRFSAAKVDHASVTKLLGHIEDVYFVTLLATILSKDVHKLLVHLQKLDRTVSSARFVWNQFVKLIHVAIRQKHGVVIDAFKQVSADIELVTRTVSWQRLYYILEQCYKQEAVFLQVHDQFAFLEMFFLQLCVGSINADFDGDKNSGVAAVADVVIPTDEADSALTHDVYDEVVGSDVVSSNEQHPDMLWKRSVHDIAALNEPLLLSLCKQSFFKSFDAVTGNLTIEFEKKFAFFKDTLDETRHKWLPCLQAWFGQHVQLIAEFTKEVLSEDRAIVPLISTQSVAALPQQVPTNKLTKQAAPVVSSAYVQRPRGGSTYKKRDTLKEIPFTLTSGQEWRKATLLLQHFPGTIYEIQEQHHG